MSKDNYTQIENHINQLSESKDVANLYDHKIVKWTGPQNPSDKKPYYSNYVAEKLLEKHDLHTLYSKINSSKRKDYLTNHDGVTDEYNNRSSEKIFAKSLFGLPLEGLGRIIDYEMPLTEREGEDNVNNPKKYGDIDLVSLNADTNTAYLIELKMNLAGKKEETVLRAALEIETYYHILEKVKENRFRDYIESKIDERYNSHTLSDVNLDRLKIRKAVLFAVDKESGLPQELQDENAGHYSHLRKLLAHLGINVHVMPYRYPVQRISLA
jgi:hypothetical protein